MYSYGDQKDIKPIKSKEDGIFAGVILYVFLCPYPLNLKTADILRIYNNNNNSHNKF